VRLFIAIPLSAELRDTIEKECRLIGSKPGLDAGLRWTPNEQLHFTLRFLGECQVQQTTGLLAAIEDLCKNRPAFPIEIRGLGVFPDPAKPRILWMGVREGTDILNEMSLRLEEACVRLGFVRETRPFHAHLTIARCASLKSPALMRQVVDEASDKTFGSFVATSLVLMKSERGRQGSVYSVVGERPFIS
jgi:RNA 2',3'-cyclic 3'-phosphodiesterase